MARYTVRVSTHSAGGLFELEETTTIEIVDEAGAVVRRYEGSSSSSLSTSGAGWVDTVSGGVWKVELVDDGAGGHRAARVYSGASVTEEPLP